MENKNKSSCDLAIERVNLGMMKIPNKNKIRINKNPPKTLFNAKEVRLIGFEKEEINIKTPTATKS